MANNATIFLHIGFNKAGSSSLQGFCHAHRKELRARGLEYPAAAVHDSAHYGLSKAWIGQPAAPAVAAPEGVENEIRAAIGARRNVLLSSEYFFLAKDQQVANVRTMLASFDAPLRVLVYLRRHDQWIASLFNQAIKTMATLHPWHSDIREYALHLLGAREFELRYSVILDRWAKHFGPEALIVRPFEAAQFRDGEFLWDALGCIDAKLPDALAAAKLQPIRANQSLPEHLLRAIAYVKSLELSPQAKSAMTAQLLRDGAMAPKSQRKGWDTRVYVLPAYLKRALVSIFADDYRHVARRYVGAKDGVLFREPVA